MASSRKKRSRAVVTLLLCLAAVCIVAALVLYGLANRKLKALQQGADFEFTYAVTSQGGTTHPALYSILDQAGATEGRMTGLSSPALWCAVALGLCALLCLRGLIGRLLRLVLRSGAGLVLLAALARFGSALGLGLGVNLTNALVLGLLGAPGFALLCLLHWVLGQTA